MVKRLLPAIVLWLTVNGSPAKGDSSVGIGAEAGTQPGLSVQYMVSPVTAYHFTGHFGDGSAAISADYQRLYIPGFGHGGDFTIATYAGIGLIGTSSRDQNGEAYGLHLPVGLQGDIEALRLSLFLEIAAVLGPVPTTNTFGAFATGLRTRF